jgi:hypothetical protein
MSTFLFFVIFGSSIPLYATTEVYYIFPFYIIMVNLAGADNFPVADSRLSCR